MEITTLHLFLHLIILFVLYYALYIMQKKNYTFSIIVFTAIFVGAIYGFLLKWLYANELDILSKIIEYFDIFGVGYIKLLKMMIMPLVVLSILYAVFKIKNKTALTQIGMIVMALLMFTVSISALIGIVTASVLHLEPIISLQGVHENLQALDKLHYQVQDYSIANMLLNMIPENVFFDLTGERNTSIIAVVFFSLFLGITTLIVGEEKPIILEKFETLIEYAYDVIMKMVNFIILLAPYGVLVLMTKAFVNNELHEILNLFWFVFAIYVAVILMFMIHLIMVSVFGANPFKYIKIVFPVLLFAFTSRSSAGTLPLNIKTQIEKLNVQKGIASFAASLGVTIGQNGCAGIYPAVIVAMLAPSLQINVYDPIWLVKVLLLIMISSFGVAGIGGGGIFAALIVLSALNMPLEIIGVLMAVEPLVDMGRTLLNVNATMVIGYITNKMIKKRDSQTALPLDG